MNDPLKRGVPGRQGTPARRRGDRNGRMETNWAPALRAGTGLAVAIAAGLGFGSRHTAGALIGGGERAQPDASA